MKVRIALVVLSLLPLALPFGSPLAAQQWRPAGPPGGVTGVLAASMSQPGLVYLLGSGSPDAGSTLYRSADSGRTWVHVPGPFVSDLFAVDPRSASTLYGLLSPDGKQLRFAESVDGGEHWLPADRGLEAAGGVTGPPVFDPADSSRLFVPTTLGVFERENAQAAWRLHALGGTRVRVLAIDSRDPAHWFAAVQVPAAGPCDPDEEPCLVPDVLESRDGGFTWVSTGLHLDLTFQILTAPGRQYALVGSRVFQRRDGMAWTATTAPGARGLALSAAGMLYAAGDLGVYHSSDGGETWLPQAAVARPYDGMISLVVLPDAAETVLAAGRARIWRSQDRGGAWLFASVGPSIQIVDDLVVAADSTVYVGLAYDGMYSSSDGGATWEKRNRGLSLNVPLFTDFISGLASDPRHAGTLCAIVLRSIQENDLYRTTDSGRSWQVLPHLPISPYAFTLRLVADPAAAHGLYLLAAEFNDPSGSGHRDVLLHSGDGGRSWSRLLEDPQAIAAFAIDPVRPGTLYARTFPHPGLLKSTDGGASWQETGRQLSFVASNTEETLAIDPRQPQTLYAGTYLGVYVSHDGGATFAPLGASLSTPPHGRQLLVDPQTPANLYLVAEAGVFRWRAESQDWLPLNNGLPDPETTRVGPLALDPLKPEILYLGTNGHGLYRLDLRP